MSDVSTLADISPSDRSTLFGAIRSDHDPTGSSRIVALGAPTDHGNGVRRGARYAPSSLREASRTRPASGAVRQLVDAGDVCSPETDLEVAHSELQAHAVEIFSRGDDLLLLGGDHSVSFASIAALAGIEPVCVIWLDAHTDFSPWSGHHTHDHKQVLARVSELPGVTSIVQIGFRDLASTDERQLGEDIVVFTSDDIRKAETCDVLSVIPEDTACYISVDVDVIDHAWLPATGTPVPFGISPQEVGALLEAVLSARRVRGIDFVELAPRLDDGRSTEVVLDLICKAVSNWGCGSNPLTLSMNSCSTE